MAQEIGLKAILDDANFQAGMSRYMSGLSTMTNSTTNASTGMTAGFTSLGGSVLKTTGFMAKAFVGATAAAGLAFGAFVGSTVSDAAGLEQQIADIGAVFGKSEFSAETFKGVILDLGVDPNLKVSASEAATAIELLARNGLFAGVSMEDMEATAFDATKSVILLQNATGTDFGNAADIATDAMALFGIEASNMEGAVDSIISVTTNSKFTIDDFNLALRNGGAVAADMGISLTEFNAVIAASAEEMGSGQKAGTGFRNFITRLTPSTNGATDAMRDLGLIVGGNNRFFDEGTGSLKSMDEIAGILDQTFSGTRDIMVEVGGRTEAQNRALTGLREQYGKAQTKIEDYTTGLIGANLSDEDRNAKIQEQTDLMTGLSPRIGELSAIRGEMAEKTLPALTDAERSAAMEMIFGADAMGTALALANEGEVSFSQLMETMEEQGVAAAAAARKMDTLQGAMEIMGGIVDTIKIKIGDAFLPVIRLMVDAISGFIDKNGDAFVAVFENMIPSLDGVEKSLGFVVDGITALMTGDIVGFLGQMGMAFGLMEDTSFDLAEVIVGKVGDAFDFIVEHADAFIGAAKGLLAVLGGAGLVAILSTIAGVLATILSPIGLVVIAVMALGAAWETNFLGIRDVLTAFWFDTVQPILAELMVWLFENVPLALEALRAAWVDVVFPAILGIIEFVWPIIQALFGIFVEYITGVFIPTLIALWEFWATVLWPGILEAVAIVWPIIQEILVAASEWFLTVLIPTLQQLFVFWSEVLWPGIIAALTAAWEFMLPILTSLAVWFLETFIPALISLWETWSIVVWPAIIASLEEAWGIIQPILNDVWIFIVDTLIPGVTELWTAWMDAWTEIDRIVTEAWAVIEGIFKEIDRWINVNLIPFVEAWQAKNEETWAAIMAKIIEVWNIIWPILEKIRMWFEEKLTAAADAVKEKIEGAFNGIKGAIDGAKSPLEAFFDKVKEFQGWLEGISFDFEFNIPDLPDWFLPGSPLPLHTAWKNFGTFLDRQQFAPQVDVTEAVNLATPLAESSSPVVNVDGGSTQNNFNLNMTTTSDEVSLRQTFRLMELASA